MKLKERQGREYAPNTKNTKHIIGLDSIYTLPSYSHKRFLVAFQMVG